VQVSTTKKTKKVPISWQTINGFTESVLAIRYDDPKPVPPHHLDIWDLCTSKYPQVAIAAPRGSAKSTAVTFAYVLASVLFEEHEHVLILSANEELAAGFLNDIKVELQENDILMSHPALGVKKFIKDRETEIIVEKHSGFRFRIIVKGAEQRMRGLKWERKRPSLVVADDLEDEELVSSELRREKFRRWFYGAVKPIIRDGGKIRVVGTIMHMDSLLMRLMPPIKNPLTTHSLLKMASTEDRAWKSVLYRAHNEDFTALLWPEMYSEHRLRILRKDFAEQGLLDVYGQEYLNDPIDKTTAYFHKDDFLPMKEEDFSRFKTFYCSGDLAITEHKRSAFTALCAGGMDSDGVLHLEDVRRGRWDSLAISDEIFSIARRFEPDTFRLEAENIQRSIGPYLYKRMDDEQYYFNIDAKPPTKDKLARAQSIRARMRAGKVRFNKDSEWYADFEEELLHFPKWPYKDQVDMFAWLGLMLDDMIEAPTDAQWTEDSLDDESEDYEYSGFCQTTGY
jgi:predicted phage terminase large subunit-like protein